MTTLLGRQVMSKQPPTPSTSSYDHRWLLFLIPICLVFIALLFTIWFLLKKRKKQRQRKSMLRNRSLVAAEQEKQREREEKRLGRGTSISSRLSRMTSVKSTTGKSFQSKKTKRDSEMEAGGENQNYQANVVVIGRPEQDETEQGDFAEEDKKEKDVEDMAEAAAAALPITLAYPEATPRVRIVENIRPTMTTRKELSVIGESPWKNKNNNESGRCNTARQDSQRSASEMTGSLSHATYSSSNPFQSPTPSSSGHQGFESPVSPSTSGRAAEVTPSTSNGSSNAGAGGLGRKLSGVIRLRQPSPAGIRAPSSTLQRSDSRASRKSSVRSFQRVETSKSNAHPPVAAASWAYTSKAAQWKSSSTDVSAPWATASEISSEQLSGSKSSKASGDQAVVMGEVSEEKEKSNLLIPVGSLARKPSTGVAGSRFVESFDED